MANDLSPAAIDKKVERYRAKLLAELELARKDHKELRALVESIFATYGDVAINLPALVTLCLQTMPDLTRENWQHKANEMQSFIRAHAHQEEWIQIRTGKAGGVRLITTHIMRGVLGATCKSVIVGRPTHSRKKIKRIKRSNAR